MNYFITAINTDSGKTVTSAIFAQALKADYWKPIQSGLPRDTDMVAQWVTNLSTQLHPEAYFMKTPVSPHAAACKEGIKIDLKKINLPDTKRELIIEGAGGVLVPLNDTNFVIDIAQHFDLQVVLVSNIYLGSINHTLLTVNELKRRGVSVRGIVFNGKSNPETEQIILQYSGYEKLLHIKPEAQITPQVIQKYAQILRQNLKF